MRILLTAGPTREPIDPVRYLGNRSSGKMGAAIAWAALDAGHIVTAILGPVEVAFPGDRGGAVGGGGMVRVDVETAQEMYEAVLKHWPGHDLLIMAAAVADYRPRTVSSTKLSRSAGPMVLELEPTEDVAAAACAVRRADQRVVGFSLEREGEVERARRKMMSKGLDLIVYNPLATMGAAEVTAELLWRDGRSEAWPMSDKGAFARRLVEASEGLFGGG